MGIFAARPIGTLKRHTRFRTEPDTRGRPGAIAMDVCMPAPVFNREPRPKPYAELVMMGLATIGIGILAGIWIAGPAMTGTGNSLASDPLTRWIPPTYGEMISRPDPSPYRTATPNFDTSGQPDYAAAAKARAQAGTTGQSTRDDWDRSISERQSGRAISRSYLDRHAVH